MGLGSRSARHETARVQKNAVDSSKFWDYQPKQRVMTVDGLPGIVTAVNDGPYPGTEEYAVTLDNGLGGGRYTASQLSAAGATTASHEHEATGAHLASDDYPEMGSILYDRPPIERIEHTASAHEARGPADLGADWIHEPENEDHPERYASHNTDAEYTKYVTKTQNFPKTHWEPSIKDWTCESNEPRDVPAVRGVRWKTPQEAVGHFNHPAGSIRVHREHHHDQSGWCHHPAHSPEFQARLDGMWPDKTASLGGGNPFAVEAAAEPPTGEPMAQEVPSACSYCGSDQLELAGDNGRVAQARCAVCHGVMSAWEGGQFTPELIGDPSNHPSQEADARSGGVGGTGNVDGPTPVRRMNDADHTASLHDAARVRQEHGWTYEKSNDLFNPIVATGPDGQSDKYFGNGLTGVRHPEHMPTPLYHGTRREIPEGAQIEPGHPGNFVKRMKHVYMVEDPEVAQHYAGPDGHVYEVQPTGFYGHRSDAKGANWASEEPLDVVRLHSGPQSRHTAVTGHELTWDAIGERHPHVYGDPEVHGEEADGADGEGIGWAANHLAHSTPDDPEADNHGSWDMHFHQEDVDPKHIDYARHGANDHRVRSAREGYTTNPDAVPPVVLVHRHGVYQVADGHHRAEGAHLAGTKVRAYVAYSPYPDEPSGEGDKAPYHGAEPHPGQFAEHREGHTASLDKDEVLFHFTASWSDVRNKAKRIRAEGRVRITVASSDGVGGEVKGDHNVYETMLTYVPGSQKVAYWHCGCKWAAYAWGRSPAYKRFEGRQCSHALAMQFEAQSRGMFGKTVQPDAERPKWMKQRTPVVIQHERDTKNDLTRRSVPPGNMRRTHGSLVEERAPLAVTAASLASGADPVVVIEELVALGFEHAWAKLLTREASLQGPVHPTRCPDCGAQISSRANRCPHCGADLTGHEPTDFHEASHTAMPSRKHTPPADMYFDHYDFPEGSEHYDEAEESHPGWSHHILRAHRSSVENGRGIPHGMTGMIYYSRTHPDAEHPGVAIHDMRTFPGQEGQGIGSAMQDELRRMHPHHMIDHGSRTDDGAGWHSQYEDPGDPKLDLAHPDNAGTENRYRPTPLAQYLMTQDLSGRRHAKKSEVDGPTHAGMVLKARDTGRILMLQRSLEDEDDPAAGCWEFPGGGIEDHDHTSLHAAIREWEEEVGQKFPHGGTLHHLWASPNGVYHGHVIVIPEERQVELHNGRVTTNPDDPDGDQAEQAAWWDVDHAKKNPALRPECKSSPWKEIAAAGGQKTAVVHEAEDYATYRKRMDEQNRLRDEHLKANPPKPVVHKPEMVDEGPHSIDDVSRHFGWEGFSAHEIEHMVHKPERAQFTLEDVPVDSLRHWGPKRSRKIPTYDQIVGDDDDERERMESLEHGYSEGHDIPPIVVVRHGDKHLIADGSHRAAIHARNGDTHIRAFVTERTKFPTKTAAAGDPLHDIEESQPYHPPMHSNTENPASTGFATSQDPPEFDHPTINSTMFPDAIYGHLHEEPEGALPFTDGADDDLDMAPTNGAELYRQTNPEVSDVDESASPNQFTGSIDDIVAKFQATAGAQAINSGSGASSGPSDSDIAQAAKKHLALKQFNFQEQQELINEGSLDNVMARNADKLDIANTHYSAIEAALAAEEATENPDDLFV